MTVKVLLDPILTARPSRCSTYIQFVTYMQHVLAKRDDVFFYFLRPDKDFDQEDLDWFPQHPNIRYVDMPQHPDRTKEYLTLRAELDTVLGFNGPLWDFDIVITVRSGMAQLYQMLLHRPGAQKWRFTKEVWVIENMPLMSFKKSVAQFSGEIQDRFTLAGYQAADRVMIMSYHEKAGALQAAREYLPPASVVHLSKKLKEVIPSQFKEPSLKDPSHFFKPGTGQQFCVAFAGRLVSTGGNLDKVYSVMTNQWIIRGGDRVRMVVTTQSKGVKEEVKPPDYMEVMQAPRDEFWRMAREEMHVTLMMFTEAGFLLSMMEPIMLGTPVIVLDAAWSRGQLGPDYPFFVTTELEAYTLVKMFYEDYEGMYAKFRKWQEEWFVPTYKIRFDRDWLYGVLDGYMADFEDRRLSTIREEFPGKKDNSVTSLLAEGMPKEIHVWDDVIRLEKEGRLRSLADKAKPNDRDRRALTFSTAWNEYRLSLMAFYGYVDAGVEVGHLKLP